MLNPNLPFESEWILKAISHDLRQKIIRLIQVNEFQTYTELLQKLSLSTGKLNFHLKQLIGLIEKQDDGSYLLTNIGKEAIEILDKIQSIGEDKEKIKYFRNLALAKSLKEFQPAPETKRKWYIWISIIYILMIWMPLTIIVLVVDFTISNFLANIQNSLRKLGYIGILTGIIISLLIISIILAKLYINEINYEILDTEITITKGLIVKKRAIIPFRTITNLVIKQGPLDIILGISNVIIQTAGESAKSEPEGKLIGIYYAKDLIEEILNLVRLLDPPSYLREKIPIISGSKNISDLYLKILNELHNIDQKLSD